MVRRYAVPGLECANLEVQELAWLLDRSIKNLEIADPLKLDSSRADMDSSTTGSWSWRLSACATLGWALPRTLQHRGGGQGRGVAPLETRPARESPARRNRWCVESILTKGDNGAMVDCAGTPLYRSRRRCSGLPVTECGQHAMPLFASCWNACSTKTRSVNRAVYTERNVFPR